MTKYQTYHDHALLPWVIEADRFVPGDIVVNPGRAALPGRPGDRGVAPTYSNDGVLRFYIAGHVSAAFPPGEWVFVTETLKGETDGR